MAVVSDVFKVYAERGAAGVVRMMWQIRTIKWGRLVGTDEMGNKYFENTDYPFGA
jgi:hypothetical protein